MKQLYILLLLITGITGSAFAQLGKMQFQDAEEQYAAGKYKETLELLDASEKSSGKSNPLIEHLRIMTWTELLKQDITANSSYLELARKEAHTFLTKYETDSRLEDKYREVYQASKTLAAFPSKAALEKQKVENGKLEEEKKALAGISFIANYRDGMTIEEIKATIPGYERETKMDTVTVLSFNNFQCSIMISTKSKRSYGYVIKQSFINKDRTCSETRAEYDRKKLEITQKLGVDPIANKPAAPEAGNARLLNLMSMLQMDNVTRWCRDTKTLTLVFECSGQKKNTPGYITLSSVNAAYY